jgi:hypothetical protein
MLYTPKHLQLGAFTMTSSKNMKLQVLDALNKISRGKKDSIAYVAAKLVLVDGLANNEAEKRLNATPQSVSNGVTRYKALDAEIREAYEMDK